MTNSDQVYKEFILENYKNPQNAGEIEKPTANAKVANYSCGDEISVSVLIENEKIADIRHKTTGCAISVAGASITTALVKGMTEKEILKLDKKDILEEMGIELTPSRLKCALLALEAIKKALTE